MGSIGAARLNDCAAIANKRLKRKRAGQLMPRAKSAHRDGTTHIVMSLPQLLLGLAVQKKVIAVTRDSTALLLPPGRAIIRAPSRSACCPGRAPVGEGGER